MQGHGAQASAEARGPGQLHFDIVEASSEIGKVAGGQKRAYSPCRGMVRSQEETQRESISGSERRLLAPGACRESV